MDMMPPGNSPVTLTRSGGTTLAARLLRKAARAMGTNERRCIACSSVYAAPDSSGPAVLFCPACLPDLRPRKRGYCPRCGELAAWPELPLALCLRCSQEPPAWDHFVFHGPYHGLLRQLLLRLKFGQEVILGHALGLLLAERLVLTHLLADAVIPLPLHRERLGRRGYNQALEIARPLAAALHCPLRPLLLRRTRATTPQSGLSLSDRKKNLLQAFTTAGDIRDKSLLLVDDTFTTGATVTAATVALKQAGAAKITVAVVSRTAKMMPSRPRRATPPGENPTATAPT